VDVVSSVRPRPCFDGLVCPSCFGKRLLWGGKPRGNRTWHRLGLATPAPGCAGAQPSLQPQALPLPPCRGCVGPGSTGQLGRAWPRAGGGPGRAGGPGPSWVCGPCRLATVTGCSPLAMTRGVKAAGQWGGAVPQEREAGAVARAVSACSALGEGAMAVAEPLGGSCPCSGEAGPGQAQPSLSRSGRAGLEAVPGAV